MVLFVSIHWSADVAVGVVVAAAADTGTFRYRQSEIRSVDKRMHCKMLVHFEVVVPWTGYRKNPSIVLELENKKNSC